MKLSQLKEEIARGRFDEELLQLYSGEELESQRGRYLSLFGNAGAEEKEAFFISVPGRTELGGNHTDHNNGRVLAASVDLDCIGLIVVDIEKVVTIHSSVLDQTIRLELDTLDRVAGEEGTPLSLVRGIAAGWCRSHTLANGFTAFLDNRIPVGGGLSSSAAFGSLVGGAFSVANGIKPDRMMLARLAHGAENNYFGKPCGLMDQLACSLGGVVSIDFREPEKPRVKELTIQPALWGYRLLLVDTGSSHEELTSHYAAIPVEMKRVTQVLGVVDGRNVHLQELLNRMPEIREQAGDRAVLRILHFLSEDIRAWDQAHCLQEGRFTDFLELVRQSGDSSWRLLQNCTASVPEEQPVALGIAVTQVICPQAVARVHGGGFAGTIQVWVPEAEVVRYEAAMEKIFGLGSVLHVKTGRPGLAVLGGEF